VPGPAGVVPEAVQRALDERRQQEVIGCPVVRLAEPAAAGNERLTVAIDLHGVVEHLRARLSHRGNAIRVRPVLVLQWATVRLRPLSEAECYARCYGGRREEAVNFVRVLADSGRRQPITGERLHELFDARPLTSEPEMEAA